MLKKFDMVNAKLLNTPMPTNGHLDLKWERESRRFQGISLHDQLPTLFVCV
jgi:hypothetical protein